MAARKGSTSSTPAPKSDAYVGLLFIALAAQITAAVFFYLDWSSYPSGTPRPPAAISIPASAPAPAPAPAPMGMPPAGGMQLGGMP